MPHAPGMPWIRAGLAIALTSLAAYAALPAAPAVARTPSRATAIYDAQRVFELLNSERAAHGLRPLRWADRLATVAHRHNRWMCRTNTLAHRLPGEPTLGEMVTATGYPWLALGENIGVSTRWRLRAILRMERLMYNEVPPDDLHRRNILSTTFRDIGVDIVMDGTHHKAWLTEVFGLRM